ncbi:penicillin-binding protein 2 [Hoyosella rhizosphaerae]|uniref:Penicillin-binding protein PbpB n=1 Tax=Hoyosella rhizosphaerae TaxID=1755582 RepID=A0A916UF31_9ACTN|nr:penicillin-binding protein 2 [Hoyosella rhizosphaerae]MBN4927919.1 penicillin-binding protein 2 [Hoyosella rhizosphaerae]GGC70991.1 penicillin-binding protein PbpB [Hoyosella rhizosphaerae]
MFCALSLIVVQLVNVQGISAPRLSAEAAKQRTVAMVDPAKRGAIVDRHGNMLAFTTEARALTFQPVRVREQLEALAELNTDAPEPRARLLEIARGVSAALDGEVSERALRRQILSDDSFHYLARSVDPAVATAIQEEFPEVGSERQDIRQYPGGALAANVIGSTGWDGHGLLGLEKSMDTELAGQNGSRTYDRSEDGAVIPGSTRDVQPAQDGKTVELTIDNDIQFFVQQATQRAVDLSGARAASAMVMDVHTGEIRAIANDGTFNPALGLGAPENQIAELGIPAISTPFEPGSVAKIVAAAAAIEDDLTTPDEVLDVDGQIRMAGVTVRDAWVHGVVPYTTTGIFGKSSNVGTLMLAERIGEERFAEMLWRFGVGLPTGVELPGESVGMVPPLDQWGGGTFANLPIGQGMSMTLLQMAGIYQAIGNDGVRIPPRIISATVDSSGHRAETPRPEAVEVVSPETARVVTDMFRSVVQSDPMGYQQGTGPQAAVPGYQISGKTGTAQQVDPNCGCYSNSMYWVTFAGIAPADDPRYVIAIMLDAPVRNVDGGGGRSAAPLFNTIASWLLQRDNVPLSAPAPKLILDTSAP